MIYVKPDPAPYDDSHYLVLEGRAGIAAGERLKVSLGETVTVGRSRTCQFSLKKTPRFLSDADGEQASIRGSLGYRSVSRHHCRIAYLAPDLVEIVNLSRNGTFVDGHRVDRIVLDDIRGPSRAHEIRLGQHGDVLRLSCGSVELSAASVAKSAGPVT